MVVFTTNTNPKLPFTVMAKLPSRQWAHTCLPRKINMQKTTHSKNDWPSFVIQQFFVNINVVYHLLTHYIQLIFWSGRPFSPYHYQLSDDVFFWCWCWSQSGAAPRGTMVRCPSNMPVAIPCKLFCLFTVRRSVACRPPTCAFPRHQQEPATLPEHNNHTPDCRPKVHTVAMFSFAC